MNITAVLIISVLWVCQGGTSVSYGAPGTLMDAGVQTSTSKDVPDSKGIRLYKEGDTSGAITTLKSELQENRSSAERWLYLGMAFSRAGKDKDALKAFRKSAKLSPLLAPAHAGVAFSLARMENLPEAAHEAVLALEADPKNSDAHYVLGVVRLRSNDYPDAVLEAEAALKSSPSLHPALLLKAQALVGTYLSELHIDERSGKPVNKESKENGKLLQQARAKQSRVLEEAAASLARYIDSLAEGIEKTKWQEQLETLRFYSQIGKPDSEVIFTNDQVQTRVAIVSKPEPAFTDQAREEGVQGTVILKVVFSADETVKHIFVVRGLPCGLTEKCINAARKIKFRPGTVDGKPMSVVATITYNFSIG